MQLLKNPEREKQKVDLKDEKPRDDTKFKDTAAKGQGGDSKFKDKSPVKDVRPKTWKEKERERQR